jgi:folylpolyglutamate synthase/dihydropteroate synthase
MGQHRSPELRLAELRKKEAGIMAQIAQENIASHPDMIALQNQKAELNKSAIKWERWLKDGKGGLDYRIAQLQVQLQEAEANLALANVEYPKIALAKKALSTEIKATRERLALEIEEEM